MDPYNNTIDGVPEWYRRMAGIKKGRVIWRKADMDKAHEKWLCKMKELENFEGKVKELERKMVDNTDANKKREMERTLRLAKNQRVHMAKSTCRAAESLGLAT